MINLQKCPKNKYDAVYCLCINSCPGKVDIFMTKTPDIPALKWIKIAADAPVPDINEVVLVYEDELMHLAYYYPTPEGNYFDFNADKYRDLNPDHPTHWLRLRGPD